MIRFRPQPDSTPFTAISGENLTTQRLDRVLSQIMSRDGVTRIVGNNYSASAANYWKNGFPDRVVIDKRGVNLAGPQNMNYLLVLNGWHSLDIYVR